MNASLYKDHSDQTKAFGSLYFLKIYCDKLEVVFLCSKKTGISYSSLFIESLPSLSKKIFSIAINISPFKKKRQKLITEY